MSKYLFIEDVLNRILLCKNPLYPSLGEQSTIGRKKNNTKTNRKINWWKNYSTWMENYKYLSQER